MIKIRTLGELHEIGLMIQRTDDSKIGQLGVQSELKIDYNIIIYVG